MKALSVIIALALGLVVSGCMFQEVREQDLIGKYQADLPGGGTEILELLAKGECSQEIRLSSGTTYNARGTWKYDSERKRLFLKGTREALTPTRELNPNIAQPPPTDTTIATPVSRTLGGALTIMLHEGIDYRKQK